MRLMELVAAVAAAQRLGHRYAFDTVAAALQSEVTQDCITVSHVLSHDGVVHDDIVVDILSSVVQ